MKFFLFAFWSFHFGHNYVPLQNSDTLALEKYLQINNIKTEKTSDGIYFSTDVEGKGALPQSGDYLQIQYTTELLDGRVVDSNERNVPFIFQLGFRHVLPIWDNMLSQFKIGSTVSLFVPPEMAYGSAGYTGIPPNTPVIFKIKLEKILSISDYEASMKAVEDIERAEFKKKEIAIFDADNKTIDAYIAKNKLKIEKTPSGARVVVNKSDSGAKITNGQKVSVFYEGSFLDGKVFDSNFGKTPFSFIVGEGKVIAGWEESIKLMKNKSESTVLLPSRLGYGATPLDDGKIIILGNSILVFKIKVVEVQ